MISFFIYIYLYLPIFNLVSIWNLPLSLFFYIIYQSFFHAVFISSYLFSLFSTLCLVVIFLSFFLYHLSLFLSFSISYLVSSCNFPFCLSTSSVSLSLMLPLSTFIYTSQTWPRVPIMSTGETNEPHIALSSPQWLREQKTDLPQQARRPGGKKMLCPVMWLWVMSWSYRVKGNGEVVRVCSVRRWRTSFWAVGVDLVYPDAGVTGV